VRATEIKNPEDFHKVVDCQYACPAHTAITAHIWHIAARLIP
jgi:formate dehydrogenase beta subunit